MDSVDLVINLSYKENGGQDSHTFLDEQLDKADKLEEKYRGITEESGYETDTIQAFNYTSETAKMVKGFMKQMSDASSQMTSEMMKVFVNPMRTLVREMGSLEEFSLQSVAGSLSGTQGRTKRLSINQHVLEATTVRESLSDLQYLFDSMFDRVPAKSKKQKDAYNIKNIGGQIGKIYDSSVQDSIIELISSYMHIAQRNKSLPYTSYEGVISAIMGQSGFEKGLKGILGDGISKEQVQAVTRFFGRQVIPSAYRRDNAGLYYGSPFVSLPTKLYSTDDVPSKFKNIYTEISRNKQGKNQMFSGAHTYSDDIDAFYEQIKDAIREDKSGELRRVAIQSGLLKAKKGEYLWRDRISSERLNQFAYNVADRFTRIRRGNPLYRDDPLIVDRMNKSSYADLRMMELLEDSPLVRPENYDKKELDKYDTKRYGSSKSPEDKIEKISSLSFPGMKVIPKTKLDEKGELVYTAPTPENIRLPKGRRAGDEKKTDKFVGMYDSQITRRLYKRAKEAGYEVNEELGTITKNGKTSFLFAKADLSDILDRDEESGQVIGLNEENSKKYGQLLSRKTIEMHGGHGKYRLGWQHGTDAYLVNEEIARLEDEARERANLPSIFDMNAGGLVTEGDRARSIKDTNNVRKFNTPSHDVDEFGVKSSDINPALINWGILYDILGIDEKSGGRIDSAAMISKNLGLPSFQGRMGNKVKFAAMSVNLETFIKNLTQRAKSLNSNLVKTITGENGETLDELWFPGLATITDELFGKNGEFKIEEVLSDFISGKVSEKNFKKKYGMSFDEFRTKYLTSVEGKNFLMGESSVKFGDMFKKLTAKQYRGMFYGENSDKTITPHISREELDKMNDNDIVTLTTQQEIDRYFKKEKEDWGFAVARTVEDFETNKQYMKHSIAQSLNLPPEMYKESAENYRKAFAQARDPAWVMKHLFAGNAKAQQDFADNPTAFVQSDQYRYIVQNYLNQLNKNKDEHLLLSEDSRMGLALPLPGEQLGVVDKVLDKLIGVDSKKRDYLQELFTQEGLEKYFLELSKNEKFSEKQRQKYETIAKDIKDGNFIISPNNKNKDISAIRSPSAPGTGVGARNLYAYDVKGGKIREAFDNAEYGLDREATYLPSMTLYKMNTGDYDGDAVWEFADKTGKILSNIREFDKEFEEINKEYAKQEERMKTESEKLPTGSEADVRRTSMYGYGAAQSKMGIGAAIIRNALQLPKGKKRNQMLLAGIKYYDLATSEMQNKGEDFEVPKEAMQALYFGRNMDRVMREVNQFDALDKEEKDVAPTSSIFKANLATMDDFSSLGFIYLSGSMFGKGLGNYEADSRLHEWLGKHYGVEDNALTRAANWYADLFMDMQGGRRLFDKEDIAKGSSRLADLEMFIRKEQEAGRNTSEYEKEMSRLRRILERMSDPHALSKENIDSVLDQVDELEKEFGLTEQSNLSEEEIKAKRDEITKKVGWDWETIEMFKGIKKNLQDGNGRSVTEALREYSKSEYESYRKRRFAQRKNLGNLSDMDFINDTAESDFPIRTSVTAVEPWMRNLTAKGEHYRLSKGYENPEEEEIRSEFGGKNESERQRRKANTEMDELLFGTSLDPNKSSYIRATAALGSAMHDAYESTWKDLAEKKITPEQVEETFRQKYKENLLPNETTGNPFSRFGLIVREKKDGTLYLEETENPEGKRFTELPGNTTARLNQLQEEKINQTFNNRHASFFAAHMAEKFKSGEIVRVAGYEGNILDEDGNLIYDYDNNFGDNQLEIEFPENLKSDDNYRKFYTHAKPDVVFQNADGTFTIVDYKSKTAGSKNSIFQSVLYAGAMKRLAKKADGDERYASFKRFVDENGNLKIRTAIGFDALTGDYYKSDITDKMIEDSEYAYAHGLTDKMEDLANGYFLGRRALANSGLTNAEARRRMNEGETLYNNRKESSGYSGMGMAEANFWQEQYNRDREKISEARGAIFKEQYRQKGIDFNGRDRFESYENQIKEMMTPEEISNFIEAFNGAEDIKNRILGDTSDITSLRNKILEARMGSVDFDINSGTSFMNQQMYKTKKSRFSETASSVAHKIADVEMQNINLLNNPLYYDMSSLSFLTTAKKMDNDVDQKNEDERAEMAKKVEESFTRNHALIESFRNDADEFYTALANEEIDESTKELDSILGKNKKKDGAELIKEAFAEKNKALVDYVKDKQEKIKELSDMIYEKDEYGRTALNKDGTIKLKEGLSDNSAFVKETKRLISKYEKQINRAESSKDASVKKSALKDLREKAGMYTGNEVLESNKYESMMQIAETESDMAQKKYKKSSIYSSEANFYRHQMELAQSNEENTRTASFAKAAILDSFGGRLSMDDYYLKNAIKQDNNIQKYLTEAVGNGSITAEEADSILNSYIGNEENRRNLSDEEYRLKTDMDNAKYDNMISRNKKYSKQPLSRIRSTFIRSYMSYMDNMKAQLTDRQNAAFTFRAEKLSRENQLNELINSGKVKEVAGENGERKFEGEKQYTDQADKLVGQIKEIDKEAEKNNGAMEKLEGNMNGFSAGISAASSSVDAFISRFSNRAFMKIIQETKQFVQEYNKSMTEIQMITLKSDNEMDNLGNVFIDKAKDLKMSIKDIMQTSSILYRQGLSDSEVSERLDVISKFSKVSGTKTDAATKLVTVAMNTGLVSNASQAADVVTALGDNAATNASEIEKGIEKAGAAAAADGTTFAQLAAMLTAITSTTQIGGNVAGRTLNTIFGRMNKIGTSELIMDENGNTVSGSTIAKQLKALGVNMYDKKGNKRSSFDVLYDLSKKWDSMSDAQQQQIATSIAGTRQYSNFAAIMQGMNEGKIDEYLDLAEESDGIVDQKYGIYTKSLEASLTDVKNAWDSLIQSLTDDGTLNSILDFIKNMIKGLENLSDGMGGLGAVITTVLPLFAGFTMMQAGFQTGQWYLALAGLGMSTISAITLSNASKFVLNEDKIREQKETYDEQYEKNFTDYDRFKELKYKKNRTQEEQEEYIGLIESLYASSKSSSDASVSINQLVDSIGNLSKTASQASDEIEEYYENLKNDQWGQFFSANEETARNLLKENITSTVNTNAHYPEFDSRIYEGLWSYNENTKRWEINDNAAEYYKDVVNYGKDTERHYGVSEAKKKAFIAKWGSLPLDTDAVFYDSSMAKLLHEASRQGAFDSIDPKFRYYSEEDWENNQPEITQEILSLMVDYYNGTGYSGQNSYASYYDKIKGYMKTYISTFADKNKLGYSDEDIELMSQYATDLYFEKRKNEGRSTSYIQEDTDEVIDEITGIIWGDSYVVSDRINHAGSFLDETKRTYSPKAPVQLEHFGLDKAANSSQYYIDEKGQIISKNKIETNYEDYLDSTAYMLYQKDKELENGLEPIYTTGEKRTVSEIREHISNGGAVTSAGQEIIDEANNAAPKYSLVNSSFLSTMDGAQSNQNSFVNKNQLGIQSDYFLSLLLSGAFGEGVEGLNNLMLFIDNDPSAAIAFSSVFGGNDKLQRIMSLTSRDSETGLWTAPDNIMSMIMDSVYDTSLTYGKKLKTTTEKARIARTAFNGFTKSNPEERIFFSPEERKLIQDREYGYYQEGYAESNEQYNELLREDANAFLTGKYNSGALSPEEYVFFAQHGGSSAYIASHTKDDLLSNSEFIGFRKQQFLNRYNDTSYGILTPEERAYWAQHGGSSAYVESMMQQEEMLSQEEFLARHPELTKDAATPEQQEYLLEALGSDLYRKVIDGSATEEELSLADMLLTNREYGNDTLTSSQQLNGIKEVRNAINTGSFFGENGYSETVADQYMSSWGGWKEYKMLKNKQANGEKLTNEEQTRLDALETSLDNFEQNSEIKLKIEGIQEAENAGRVLAGTAEEAEKLRKGGIISLDVQTNIRSNAFTEGQQTAKLYDGTVQEQDEAAMSILKMSADEYYADRAGNLAAAKADESARRSARAETWMDRYTSAKDDESEQQKIIDAAKKAGYKFENGEFVFDENLLAINSANPLLSQQQTYSTSEKYNMLQDIINGKVVRTDDNALLYDAAVSSAGENTQRLLWIREHNKTYENDQIEIPDWLLYFSEQEQKDARFQQITNTSSQFEQAQQAQFALDNYNTENRKLIASYLGMSEKDIENIWNNGEGKTELQKMLSDKQKALLTGVGQMFDIDINTSDMSIAKQQILEAASKAEGAEKQFLLNIANNLDSIAGIIGSSPVTLEDAFGNADNTLNKNSYMYKMLDFFLTKGNISTAKQIGENGLPEDVILSEYKALSPEEKEFWAQHGGFDAYNAQVNKERGLAYGISNTPGWDQSWNQELESHSDWVAMLSMYQGGYINDEQLNTFFAGQRNGNENKSWMFDTAASILFPNNYQNGIWSAEGMAEAASEVQSNPYMLPMYDMLIKEFPELNDVINQTNHSAEKLNENWNAKRVSEITKYSHAVSNVSSAFVKIGKGGNYASEGMEMLRLDMKDLQDQATAIKKAKGKSGKQLDKQTREIIAEMFEGISADQVEKMTEQELADLLTGAPERINLMFSDMLQSAVDFANPQIDISNIEVGVNGEISLDQLLSACDEAGATVLNSIVGMAGEYGKVMFRVIEEGDVVRVVAEVDTTAKNTYNKKGGGGGGKSKIDKLLERQKHELQAKQHKIKMIQFQETKYESDSQISNQIKMLEEEKKAQQELLEASKAQKSELVSKLSTVKKGSDDWYKLAEAIQQLEETEESTINTMADLTRKINEQRQAILKLHTDLEKAVLDEMNLRIEEEKKIIEGTSSAETTILEVIKQRFQDEWDLISKDIDKKKEALEKEKSLIQERLQARKDAEDKAASYEKLNEMKKQLSMIEMDSTRTKDAQQLRKQIAEQQKELSWTDAENEANNQMNILEDQISAYDQFQSDGSEALELLLSDANNFAEEIQKILEMSMDDFLQWLKDNDHEYLNSLDGTQKTMIENWKDTFKQMKGIVDTYWDEITSILSTKEGFLNYMTQGSTYQNASKDEQKQMYWQWGQMYDNWQKAQMSEATYSHDDEWGYGSSGGGSGSGDGSGNKHRYEFKWDNETYKKSGFATTEEANKEAISLINSLLKKNRDKADKDYPNGGTIRDYYYSVASKNYKAAKDSLHVYKKGGIVDFTGPAWVDGTKTRPEAFLNADQTAMIKLFAEELSILNKCSLPFMTNYDTSSISSLNNTVGDINITINGAEFNNDDSYEEIANKVGEAFAKQLEKNGFSTTNFNF